jgi:hypothetical protein
VRHGMKKEKNIHNLLVDIAQILEFEEKIFLKENGSSFKAK